jgi:hypothetical protein
VTAAEEDIFVETKLLAGEKHWILLAFNRSEKRTAAEFAVALPPGDFRARDLETGETVEGAVRNGRLALTVTMEPGGVWVVALEKT